MDKWMWMEGVNNIWLQALTSLLCPRNLWMTSSGRLVPVSPAVEEQEEEVEDMMALVSGSGVVSLPSTTRSPAHSSSLFSTVFWNTLYRSLPLSHHQEDPRERRKWKLWILQKLCERSILRQCPQTLDTCQ